MQRTRGFRRATDGCGASVGRGVAVWGTLANGNGKSNNNGNGKRRSRFPSGMTNKRDGGNWGGGYDGGFWGGGWGGGAAAVPVWWWIRVPGADGVQVRRGWGVGGGGG